MNFFPGMDISRDLPREQKLQIKKLWRISQFRHLENTCRRRDKNGNKLKTQWKLVVCFAFKFYCIFDWCSFLSRVARVQTTLPSVKNPQRGFCDLPLIIFYVFTNNFAYIMMTKNSVARIFPTSSQGLLAFQYGGGRWEDPGTQQKSRDWFVHGEWKFIQNGGQDKEWEDLGTRSWDWWKNKQNGGKGKLERS